MTTKRKPQRPRLEQAQDSNVWGGFNKHEALPYIGVSSEYDAHSATLSLKDVTRLRKFLEKCEAYLQAKRGRK